MTLRLALASILLLVATACETSHLLGPDTPVVPAEAGAFVERLNEYRRSVGCGPLSWHPAAAGVASLHSEDMSSRQYFSHISPEGLSAFNRLSKAGVRYRNAAENIARGFRGSDAALTAWLNSKPHRENIENCALTHHGLGWHGTYWTHILLLPR